MNDTNMSAECVYTVYYFMYLCVCVCTWHLQSVRNYTVGFIKPNTHIHLSSYAPVSAALKLLQIPLLFPNIHFLHPPPAPPSEPLPQLVYIIAWLWSTAVPYRHCHGNSGTTAGWLPLLPGGAASSSHFTALLSHLWSFPVVNITAKHWQKTLLHYYC